MVQMYKHAVHQQNLASPFVSTFVLLVKLIMTKPTGLVTQPTFDFSAISLCLFYLSLEVFGSYGFHGISWYGHYSNFQKCYLK